MTTRASINQQTQIGLESTPGTSVAAGKVLEALNVNLGAKAQTKNFRPQGRKFASQVLIEQEWAESKYDGIADFASLAYPLSVFGAPTTTAVGTTGTQRVYSPLLTGKTSIQTFTIQKGSQSYAEQIAYGLFNSFTLKIDRKEIVISGDILSQSLSEGITLTASPTIVQAVPILANMANVYLDSTSAGIGTTLLTDTYATEFSYAGAFGATWPINRANSSFGSVVDLAPKSQVKLTMQADAVAAGLKSAMEAGSYQYIRMDCLGPSFETTHNQKLTIDLACKVSNIGAFGDKDGIYTVEYTLDVVEDPSWGANGQAISATLINLLSAI